MNKINKINKTIILILIIFVTSLSIPKLEYAANTTLKIGDINGDGAIDSRDTLRILEHIAATTIPKIKQNHADWILKDEKLKAGDINEDGVIDSRDTLRELEYIAASTIPTIAQKHPDWKKYIESKWVAEATKTTSTIAKSNTSQNTKQNTAQNTKQNTAQNTKQNTAQNTTQNTVQNTKQNTTQSTAQNTKQNTTQNTAQNTKQNTTQSKTTTVAKTTKNISNTSIALNSTSLTYNGKAQTPIVTIKDGAKVLKNGTDYTLAYSNNINVGTATMVITGKGNYIGKVTKTFKINKATYNMNNVKFNNMIVTYDGRPHSIIATDLPLGVKATYTGNGKVETGIYTVTAKFTGNTTNYNTIPAKKATLRIKAMPIIGATIKGIANKTYTGKAITQNIVVKDRNIVLRRGKDYNLVYTNNINVGTARIAIMGKGNYTGVETKTFKINKATYNMNNVKFNNLTVTYDGKSHSIIATGLPKGVKVTYTGNGKVATGTYIVTAKFTGNTTNYKAIPDKKATLKINAKSITKITITGISDKTYTGKAITQNVAVKDETKVLKSGTDYTLDYSNNINVGTATIAITGKGNYTGKVTKTFKINKATYNMKNVKFADSTVTYDGKEHSIVATGLPSGVKVTYTGNGKTEVGTYIVTAKFEGDNTKYHTIADKKATLKINAKSIDKTTITGIEDKTYIGKAITQNVVVKDGSKTLKKGTDYTLKYKDNIYAGTASVVITGKGNYTGTVTKTFEIKVIAVTGIKLDKKLIKLKKGQSIKLSATIEPYNATDKRIFWSAYKKYDLNIDDSKKISVKKDGTITAKETGFARAVAHSEYNYSIFDICLIYIVE